MAEQQFGVGAELQGQAAQTAGRVDQIANDNAQTNSANALKGVQQMTGFTQDLALEQQKAQAAQKLSMQKYQAGYVKVTPALAVGLAGSLNNPDMLKLQDQEVPAGLLLGLVKNSTAQGVAKTKADSAEDVADTKAGSATDVANINADAKSPKVVYGTVNGKKTAGTMGKDADGNPVWTPAKGDEGAPPVAGKGGANAGLKTDEDAHKYADQWYDRVQKANDHLMGAFQKKLGLPEGSSISDVVEKWAGLSDDKKAANQAVFRQEIAQYEHAKNTYNKYASAAGQEPFPEDQEGINQLKKLAGSAPAAGGGRPAPVDQAKRQKAIDYLTKNKAPVTDKNIVYIMGQLGN